MKQKYMQKSISISNKYMFVNIILKMLVVFHLFSCTWISIGNEEKGWRNQILAEYYRETYIKENKTNWVRQINFCPPPGVGN